MLVSAKGQVLHDGECVWEATGDTPNKGGNHLGWRGNVQVFFVQLLEHEEGRKDLWEPVSYGLPITGVEVGLHANVVVQFCRCEAWKLRSFDSDLVLGGFPQG